MSKEEIAKLAAKNRNLDSMVQNLRQSIGVHKRESKNQAAQIHNLENFVEGLQQRLTDLEDRLSGE